MNKRILAFPTATDSGYDLDGMSLRDWFAGLALCGMMGDESRNGANDQYAKEAYEMANAMTKEREKYEA